MRTIMQPNASPVHLPARLREAALFRPAPNPTFGNPAFADARVRVLILRLSPWRDVARSSPHLFLAQAVRHTFADAYLDFAFLPLPEDRRLMREAHVPLALGSQSRRGLAAFDLVLVSNAFTLELINLPVLLLDAGLPAWAEARPEDAPPIILGGSNAFASHALVRPDGVGVADAVFFGEGEDALAPFLRAWHAAAGMPKRARLLRAAEAADGFWVTGSWPERPVRQAVARRAPEAPDACPLLNGEAADTVRLPVTRGCPAFCSFCFEGYERKPYRETSVDDLIAQARRLKAASGARTVELDSCTLTSHTGFTRLLAACAGLYDHVSFKSQRVDVLAGQPALLPLELAAGKRSFTLGIEGITKRLRAFLNKSLDDDAIARVLHDLLAAQVREIKLFYLITGYETAADIADFGTFVGQLADSKTGPRRTTRVVFSFGYLVRMPNTPLRYDRLALDRAPLAHMADNLERICTRSGFEFRLAAPWNDYATTQVLAAGDYRLAPVVVALAADGWLYDGELPPAYLKRLQEGLEAAGLDRETLARAKPASHRFPFDFVATPVRPKFLHRQYVAAGRHRDTGYCLGGTCRTCGACLDAGERHALTRRARVPEISDTAAAEVDALTRAKQRLAPCCCRVRLGLSFAQTTPEWTSARLLQLLLTSLPDETDNLLAAEEALFGAPDVRDRFPMPTGETVVALKAWDAARLASRLHRLQDVAGSEFQLLEILPSFEPGRFVSATWQVAWIAPPGQLEAAITAWLKAAHLLFTLRRDGPDACFDLAPATLRKREVLSITCHERDGRSVGEVTLTPKADLLALIRLLPPMADDPQAVTCLRVVLA